MSNLPAGHGQTALVTGASSGLGEALARRFARAGFNIVLVARSVDKLEALAKALRAEHGVKAWVARADLAAPGVARQLRIAMQRARRPIHVLVNNAGVLEHGRFVEMAPRRHREMIDLNVAALTDMLMQFLPAMVARGSGRVLNVASIAAFQPVPMLATYAATKAYVLSLGESLAEELIGTGVSISTLCPGITSTPMLARARQSSRELDRLPGFVVARAEDVAEEGFAACMRAEVIRVPGALNQTAILAGRATPRWLLRRVVGAVTRGLRP